MRLVHLNSRDGEFMNLCKAISEATSQQVVFFLTSAYIETLQCATCASAWPVHVTTLPLAGACDLKRRRDVLKALIAMYCPERHATRSELEEAHEVFETALRRLAALNATGETGTRHIPRAESSGTLRPHR
jgi:hypothetical protein